MSFRRFLRIVPIWWCVLAGTVCPPSDLKAQGGEDSCEPQRLRDLQLLITEGEDFLAQKLAQDALQSVTQAESLLICINDVVPDTELGSLFRLKGAVLITLGGTSRKAQAVTSFQDAFLLNPGLSCEVGGLPSVAKTECRKAASEVNARPTVDFSLTGHHSGVKLYLDGEKLEPTSPGVVELQLKPGKHLLQVQNSSGYINQMVAVPLSGGSFSLVPLVGEAPSAAVARAKGTIRIQGLPRDAQVTLDGRDRRDLPVLEQIDPGSHYLKIASASMGVYGVNVTVESGQEVLHVVDFGGEEPSGREPRPSRDDRNNNPPPSDEDEGGGGGISPLRLASFGSFGVSGLSLVGGAGAFVVSSGRYAAADESYDAYLKSTDPDEVVALYEEADNLRLEGIRFQAMGWGLTGLALAAGGAGTFFFLNSGGEGEVSRVLVLPLASRTGGPSLGLSLAGQF